MRKPLVAGNWKMNGSTASITALLHSVIAGREQFAAERCEQLVFPSHVYLSQVVETGVAYIGLLGPRARRDRLLSEIGAPDANVHGPAGLDLGAEMPESIALAIIAEVHAFLNRRDGSMLTQTAQ